MSMNNNDSDSNNPEWCFWVLLGLAALCFIGFPWLGIFM